MEEIKQPRRWQKWIANEEEKLKELYELGYPYKIIARDLGRSIHSIVARIQWFIQQNIVTKDSFKKRKWGQGKEIKNNQKQQR